MLIQELSKRLSRGVGHPTNHGVQCTLGSSYRTHTVMDAARSSTALTQRHSKNLGNEHSPKSPLNNLTLAVKMCNEQRSQAEHYLEPPTPPKHEVAQRDPHVVVDNLTMSLRGVVITKDLHRPHYFHTRCICGDENHALLSMGILVIRVIFAHDEMHFRPRITRTTDVPVHNVVSETRTPRQSIGYTIYDR